MIPRKERRDKERERERERELPAARVRAGETEAKSRSVRRAAIDPHGVSIPPTMTRRRQSHRRASGAADAVSRGAKSGARTENDCRRTWCADARARARTRVATVAVSEGESRRGKEIVLLLFLLVRRYVPVQDPIEQTLTPRDDVGAKERE